VVKNPDPVDVCIAEVRKSALEKAPERHTRIITIASGKGGVGKTNISLNLALSLSGGIVRSACWMLTGLANIDVLIGLSPEHSLIEFLENKCSLEELMLSGPDSLKIIRVERRWARSATRRRGQRETHENLSVSPAFDYMVIDVAAGISEQVLHFLRLPAFPFCPGPGTTLSLTRMPSSNPPQERRQTRFSS